MRVAYRLPVRALTASYACLGHGKRVLRTSRSIWISKHLGLLASAYALTHHRGYAIWVAFCLRASYRHVHVVRSHICFVPGIGMSMWCTRTSQRLWSVCETTTHHNGCDLLRYVHLVRPHITEYCLFRRLSFLRSHHRGICSGHQRNMWCDQAL